MNRAAILQRARASQATAAPFIDQETVKAVLSGTWGAPEHRNTAKTKLTNTASPQEKWTKHPHHRTP